MLRVLSAVGKRHGFPAGEFLNREEVLFKMGSATDLPHSTLGAKIPHQRKGRNPGSGLLQENLENGKQV